MQNISSQAELLAHDCNPAQGKTSYLQPPMLLVRAFLNQAQQQALWAEAQQYPLQKPTVEVFGKSHPIPRTQVWFGDPGCDYLYSGLMVKALPWPKYCERLRHKLLREFQLPSNGVLVNHYADGRDCMGWHSDDEPELQPGSDIASVTIGAARDFDIRHRHSGEKIRLVLSSGDLLIMRWPMQQFWQHSVPKRLTLRQPRLNFTFRQLIPFFHGD
ncbi:alpha-ketoglutarate-dependent dioxygenase AlkB family protein [Shewanella dokdonensis]|uniref:Alpha-ketoglutarate-dependent dioxygenase AlkB n=1 Tax=Shewanella dokdonensis TaxID=712036 RepID=A0ABX8DCU9_9GAMM|nr:alpha-ketoglutarate-dependent dioxygenase AlkB [Shewanella dokdonensis]